MRWTASRLALLILAALLTATAVAFATGTLSVPINFGSYTAGVHNLADFDTNFASVVNYINTRELTLDVAANRPAAGVHGRYFFSTDTKVFSCDDGSAWQQCATQAVYTNELTGLTTATVSQVNQITVASGAAASDDATITNRVLMTLASATQGNTAGTWVVGNFQNKLDVGALGASQTWHIFEIQRTDTGNVDILFSQSASAPTMPTNYTKKRAIGAFLTDASSNLRGYYQNGDAFMFKSPPSLDVNSTGASTGTTAFTASATVANGVRVEAILHVELNNNTTTAWQVYASSLDGTDDAPSTTVAPLSSSPNSGAQINTGAAQIRVWTDTARSYRLRTSAGAVGDILRVVTLGFVYPRRP